MGLTGHMCTIPWVAGQSPWGWVGSWALELWEGVGKGEEKDMKLSGEEWRKAHFMC